MSSSLNIEEVERESVDESEEVPLTKPLRGATLPRTPTTSGIVKKPRTAKQMEALARGREK